MKTKRVLPGSLMKMMPIDRVDPTAEIRVAFDAIQQSFTALIRPSAKEQRYLRLCKQAILHLLGQARGLNSFPFWDDVELPRGVASDPDPQARRLEFDEIRASLTSEDCEGTGSNIGELLDAMIRTDGLYRTMATQFAHGRLSEDDYGLDQDVDELRLHRFQCAAILPTAVKLLDDKWIPLLKKLDAKRYRRWKGDHVTG